MTRVFQLKGRSPADIIIEDPGSEVPPYIVPDKIVDVIKSIKKKNTSTVPDDVPLGIVLEFADFLSFPLASIINRSILFFSFKCK